MFALLLFKFRMLSGKLNWSLLHPERFLARPSKELLPPRLYSSVLHYRGLGNLKSAASGLCTVPVSRLGLVLDWFAEE